MIRKKEQLIIFTRYPEPGTTKTRLVPDLSPEGAAELQRKMTEWTLEKVKKISIPRQLIVEIRYEGGDKHLTRSWLGPDFIYRPQGIGDLGLRMKRSFKDAFSTGVASAVIIGTDIPDLTDGIIQKAFNSLKTKEAVLGPAKDGGYYLIGLQRESLSQAPDLFDDINWGTESVLDKTLMVVRRSGLSFTLLGTLSDVDRPEDLQIWDGSEKLKNHGSVTGCISVIIPTINEVDNIEKILKSIRLGDNREVIVADGGSNDGTVALAKSLGAIVINGSQPKALQMNQGAMKATGDVLLFLHADTLLPDKFDEHVFKCIRRPGVAAGAFKLRIDSHIPALRLIERLANWRSDSLRTPYGDQAIFISSKLFHQVGGFPIIPIMEDFELVRRLRKRGKLVTLQIPVYTSARRWKNLGIFKTTLINQMVIAAYFMGISPNIISRWYQRKKGTAKKRVG